MDDKQKEKEKVTRYWTEVVIALIFGGLMAWIFAE